MAMRTSPGKGKRPTLMAPALKVRAYNFTVARVELSSIYQWLKNNFCVMLDSLNWHASRRSLSFIRLPQMSTARAYHFSWRIYFEDEPLNF